MSLNTWFQPQFLGLAILLLFVASSVVLGQRHKRNTQNNSQSMFRRIPALTRLRKATMQALENGTRLHLSIGSGSVMGIRGAAGLVGVQLVQEIARKMAKGDAVPLATSGEGTLFMLSEQALENGYKQAGVENHFNPETSQVTGVTPLSYAAGCMPAALGYPVEATFILGHLGVEAALMVDGAQRAGQLAMAASDSIPAQAALFAVADESLLGEEVYAAGGYISSDPHQIASLQAEDILRWGIILLILAMCGLKILGVW